MLEPLPFSAAMEEMNTISPSPLALSIGANARTVANWPRQLTANIASIRASSSASKSLCGTALVNPALFTSTSKRPNRSATARSRATMLAVSATSAGNAE